MFLPGLERRSSVGQTKRNTYFVEASHPEKESSTDGSLFEAGIILQTKRTQQNKNFVAFEEKI